MRNEKSDEKSERMKVELLDLWQRIWDAEEEARPALRTRYARAYEHYRAHRDGACTAGDDR